MNDIERIGFWNNDSTSHDDVWVDPGSTFIFEDNGVRYRTIDLNKEYNLGHHSPIIVKEYELFGNKNR